MEAHFELRKLAGIEDSARQIVIIDLHMASVLALSDVVEREVDSTGPSDAHRLEESGSILELLVDPTLRPSKLCCHDVDHSWKSFERGLGVQEGQARPPRNDVHCRVGVLAAAGPGHL